MNRAIYKVDLVGDEFANLVLSQTPAEQPQEVNSVAWTTNSRQGEGKGVSYLILRLALVCITCWLILMR